MIENASGAGRGLLPLSHFFFSRRERPPLEGKKSSCLILSEYVGEETALGLALLAARSFRRFRLRDFRIRMKFRLSENGDLIYCFIYLFSIELKPLNFRYPDWHATTTELWETQVKL